MIGLHLSRLEDGLLVPRRSEWPIICQGVDIKGSLDEEISLAFSLDCPTRLPVLCRVDYDCYFKVCVGGERIGKLGVPFTFPPRSFVLSKNTRLVVGATPCFWFRSDLTGFLLCILFQSAVRGGPHSVLLVFIPLAHHLHLSPPTFVNPAWCFVLKFTSV